ncbi:hypothetical protein ABZ387_35160 [Streptomyces flaveolus]|uniref:hypothetical protein n=1 Tax=Streptomyces flaveolus TaxID=67297 RepID=UPI0033C8560F
MEAFWEAWKADVGTGPGSALPDGAQETGVARAGGHGRAQHRSDVLVPRVT